MTQQLKLRYVFGIPGKPESYFFKILSIEDIEHFHPLVNLTDDQISNGYKIISRDRLTPFKCKNGQEIYEHDRVIYSWKDDHWTSGYDRFEEKEVVFKNFSWSIRNYDNLEIIGNTHGVKS